MADSSVRVLNEAHGETWSAYQADCVDFASQMPPECIDLSVYSPPFANLYVYGDSAADMGNCEDHEEFLTQYRFLIAEKLRITKPGRISVVHCIDMPRFKWRDGDVSLYDFPGAITAAHVEAGWLYHSRVTIWKDPVTEMQRTKSIGLLHKQLKKDSCMSRMGLPDYLLVFRKPGENPEPVEHTNDDFPVELWQRYASPVWFDIDQQDTLNGRLARDDKDERHICPLQLGVIERAIRLWSNPDDTVFSPFMGIGSEGYQALRFGRRFIGTELKESYFTHAVGYLQQCEAESATLFA